MCSQRNLPIHDTAVGVKNRKSTSTTTTTTENGEERELWERDGVGNRWRGERRLNEKEFREETETRETIIVEET